MRETSSLASSFERQELPASLMQRLEIMRQMALRAQEDSKSTAVALWRPRGRAQVIVLAWFSLGVLMSGAAGVGAVLGLRALEARGTPLTFESVRATLGATLASAWAKMPPVAFAPRPGETADGPWERIEVRIDAAKRLHAPLGLRVTGGDGQPVFFVLDGLPKGVRPSQGAAVGPATWVVASTDIEGLHLAIDEEAPAVFQMRIALLSATGIAKSGNLVEVRLVDAATAQAAADREDKGSP